MHPSGLSDKQIADIHRQWDERTTIDSLAKRYNTTADWIRRIIAMPRKR